MTAEQHDELLVVLRGAARSLVANRRQLRAALLGGHKDAANRLTAPLLALLEADEITTH